MTSTKFSFVRGKTLLAQSPVAVREKFGMQIIHQSWKSENIPKAHVQHVCSWSTHHPQALHVLWTDEDNAALVKDHYPQWVDTYTNLVLAIQRCDMVRLLYLHRFGGVYADLDYEAHQNIFQHLPANAQCCIVESPVMLNEVMQNSLMVSTVQEHPFWKKSVESIVEIHSFIQSPNECKEKKWGGCKLLDLFHNIFTKKIANLAFTLYITGPAVLDKTCVRHREEGWRLALLNKEQWFMGQFAGNDGIATHHQANTWVKFAGNMPELIGVGSVMLLLIIVLAVWLALVYAQRRCKVWRQS